MEPAFITRPKGSKKVKNHTPGIGTVRTIAQESDGKHRVEIRHGKEQKSGPHPMDEYPMTSTVYPHPDDLKNLKVGHKVRVRVEPHTGADPEC